jgi:hypothetical protein
VSLSRIVVEVLVGLLALGLLVFAIFADDAWFQTHMMYRYCVVDAASLPRAHVGRAVCAVLALALLALARPRLGRWASQRGLASLGGSMLRVVVPVVLALVVTDVFLRIRGRKPSPAPPRAVIEKRHMAWDIEVPRKAHHAVDVDGLRTRTPDDVPDLAAPTILFSGESVVWGHGLDFDDTLPAMVAARTRLQTVNLGVKGFGNDDSLALLERMLPRFEHPVAVVSFVLYNWIARNVVPGPTRLVLGAKGALEQPPPPSWSLLDGSPLFAVLRAVVPYRGDDAVELTRAILRRTAEVARSRGAYPLFVLTQCLVRCHDAGPNGPWLATRLVEGQPFTAIRVELDPNMEIPNDGHPDPRANARYADEIERALSGPLAGRSL